MITTHHTALFMEEKNLDQVVIQGLEYEAIEKEKAAERKALTRKYGLKPEDAKYSQDIQGQTRDIVAKKLGISGKHWERMKYIFFNKDQCNQQEYSDWNIGKISTSKLYIKIKNEQDIGAKIDKILEDLHKLNINTPRNTEKIYDKLRYDLFNQPYLKDQVFSSLDEIKEIYNDYADINAMMLINIIGEMEELKKKLQK